MLCKVLFKNIPRLCTTLLNVSLSQECEGENAYISIKAFLEKYPDKKKRENASIRELHYVTNVRRKDLMHNNLKKGERFKCIKMQHKFSLSKRIGRS